MNKVISHCSNLAKSTMFSSHTLKLKLKLKLKLS